jgi:hypothetical protein
MSEKITRRSGKKKDDERVARHGKQGEKMTEEDRGRKTERNKKIKRQKCGRGWKDRQ